MRKMRGFYYTFLIAVICVLNLSWLSTLAYGQTSASLSLSPTSGTFNRGCTFSLDVKVDTGGAQTDGTDAIIFYDPTRFTAINVKTKTIYQSYPQSSIFEEEGKVAIAGVASSTTPFVGAGTLATIDFQVAAQAPTGVTQIKFDFDPNNREKTNDSNIVDRATTSDILSKVNNGSYTIGTGTCKGVSTITPQPTGQGGPTTTDELPQSGSMETTVVLAVAGSALVLIGILGLLLL